MIVEFLGLPIVSAGDFLGRISRTLPGLNARITVIREERVRSFEVAVGELSSPPPDREPRHLERPDYGLTLADDASSSRRAIAGPFVEQVQSGGVADTAGLETGDVVRKVNRQTTRTAAEAMHELRRMPTGGTAFLLIWRDGDELLVELPTE